MNFRSLFLTLSFSAVAVTTLYAQEKHVKDPSESQLLNTQTYIELLSSDLNAQRRQIINETMQLDDKQARIFWPIYNDYEANLDKLGDEKLAIVQEYATNFLTMTNEKADELAQRVMALDDQKMALRRKYYDLMKKSLPAILVVRFFQVENQIQLLVDLKIASNLPIIEATDQKWLG
jgi:hypothetical protein